MRRRRQCSKIATVAALAVLVAACGSEGGAGGDSIAERYDLRGEQLGERGGRDTTRFVVGSKDFEEQEILGQITLLALDAAGAGVDSTAPSGRPAGPLPRRRGS